MNLPQEELTLARLTASKLGKVMHGLISVGIASLEMPSPTDFLTGRDKVPLALLEVLRATGVSAGHADQIERLRQHVSQLAELTSRFHRLFMELAHWRSMSSEEIQTAVERLGDCYVRFCQSLEDFCSLLGMDSDYSEQAQQDRTMLEAFFQTLPAH